MQRFQLCVGHGGQLIVLLDDLEMVIVVTSDPLHGQHGGDAWKHEKANVNLVGKFVLCLPEEWLARRPDVSVGERCVGRARARGQAPVPTFPFWNPR